MALIDCPECAKQVSDQSVNCPNCGFPIKSPLTPPPFTTSSPPPFTTSENSTAPASSKKKSFIINTILIIFGSWLVYSFITSGFFDSPAVTDAVSENAPIDIEATASQIIATYEENEVKADAILKGKTIKVTGLVSGISSDITDSAVVMLAPNGNEYTISAVHASGNSEFQKRAINLKKKQKITLICIGDGEVVGSPMLSKCRFA